MSKRLKVYGWLSRRHPEGQIRCICAATSASEVTKIAGYKYPYQLLNLVQTWNGQEVREAMANPRTVLWRPFGFTILDKQPKQEITMSVKSVDRNVLGYMLIRNATSANVKKIVAAAKCLGIRLSAQNLASLRNRFIAEFTTHLDRFSVACIINAFNAIQDEQVAESLHNHGDDDDSTIEVGTKSEMIRG